MWVRGCQACNRRFRHNAPTLIDTPTIAASLVERHGEAERARIERGVRQVATRWCDADGDAAALSGFCLARFVPTGANLDRLLARIEGALEQVNGHLYEMHRTLRRHSDLAGDEFPGIDEMLATFDPAPDLSEQFYRQRIAFVALLNFDRADLETMLRVGPDWSISEWAAVRVAQSFGPRIPKELSQKARLVGHASQQWVSGFHIPVGTLIDQRGQRWYAPDRALLTHWLVREEIKAQYNTEGGLSRQRALAGVLGRAIDGGIPRGVMDRSSVGDWDPVSGTIGGEPIAPTTTMGVARYERWLEQFALSREFDAYFPEHPTAMARKFELYREIPESEVERLLEELLEHPVRAQLARLLAERLGRPLEPFDIYFDDIAEARPGSELDAEVRRHYPDEQAFERGIPELLRRLGYSPADAEFLGTRIRVEIARGSGHAMRPQLTQYGAWLRTSRLKDQLGWDGFDTAMHELGHNLEQLCSTYFAPRPSLRNVPNTACTEAFAFLYQSLGKRALGIESDSDTERANAVDSVQTMLATCQIAGPSLLEMRVWRWLYAHPGATAAELRTEVIAIASRLWSKHYERYFGADSNHLLAAYQHMISHPLYLADYALGHVMSHQIRSHMRGKDLAAETKRITSIGRFTPDLWMRKAVGSGISGTALATDAQVALNLLR